MLSGSLEGRAAFLFVRVTCCHHSAVSRVTAKLENNENRESGGVREMSSRNHIFICCLCSSEVENLSALVVSFGLVRMGSFHSSVTVMLLSDGSLRVEPTNGALLSDQSTSISASCHVTLHYYASPAGDQGSLITTLGTAAKTCSTGTSESRRVLLRSLLLRKTCADCVISKQMTGQPAAGM